MSAFLSPLVLRALAPAELKARGRTTQLYELMADFSYASDLLGKTITVLSGFETDFASIPRAVWAWMDPEDPVILFPSVIHDDGYTRGYCTREQADGLLDEAMGICGASGFDRFVVSKAVRLFGGSHWKQP